MLDHDTTIKLIKQAQAGDKQALTDLLVNNMPLVKSIAKRYKNRQIEYDDLLQLGSLGFVKAVSNFDSSYNVRFSTYAVPMIAGEIKRYIRDDGAIKVSRMVKLLNSKMQAYISDFCQQNDRQPSIEEIAKHFDVDVHEAVFALDSSKYPVSIYEKFDDESKGCVLDKLSDGQGENDMLDKIMLKDVIKSLPERERNVIVLRYYRDKTQSEIASILGVSQVQISRIESKVLKELRKALS